MRHRRYLGLPITDDLALALAMRVKPDENGCLIWQGGTRKAGYGVWKWKGRCNSAHRWVWETFVGPIPDGLEIDHLCRNRACQNISHMELVTHAENMARAHSPKGEDNFNGAKDQCPSGHPYDEANTYHYRGRRYCRTCKKAHIAAWRARQGQVGT